MTSEKNEARQQVSGEFGFNFEEVLVNSEAALQFLCSSYIFSSILFTATELSVFDCLVNAPKTCEQIATQIEVPVDALERLLIAITAMGLVERDSTGNYCNSELATRFLTTESSQSICSLLLFYKRCYNLFGYLSESIKTGKLQVDKYELFKNHHNLQDFYTELTQYPEEYFIFLEVMNISSAGIGEAIAKQVDFGNIKQLIDLGAGGGQVSIELARIFPHLSITMVDLPLSCNFIEQRIKENELTQQIQSISGDIFQDAWNELKPADAVLLSGILADWNADQRRQILHNSWNLLKPGGQLLISETLFNEQKTGPVSPAILSLFMLLFMQGNNFTPSEISLMLQEAGFVEINFFLKRETGVRDLIVARKPY
jgi:2-polyprenyl-3-methyl-5-hydroxy-6-metoxy-1,4-benzoquinol methylase